MRGANFGLVSSWSEHVSAALLGTRRRAVPEPPRPARDEPTGGGSSGREAAEREAAAVEPAERLLSQAALLTVRRRAGRPPGRAEPVAPAPADTTPVVGGDAARRLERILGGEHLRLLPEWLDAAAARGLRVPARMLPALLEKGRTDRALRPSIARAAGARAVWLALQNTDWAYLVGEGDAPSDDPQVWQTGTRAQRAAHLMRLRGDDPAVARRVLGETWAGEPAPDRAAFLATFSRELSADDEEFLEAALDDRGKDVRQLAADLLAALPRSGYAQRMAERARGRIRTEARRVRGRRQTWLVAAPPETHTHDMARDGIPFHPAGSFAPSGSGTPVGSRAGWLREIVARAPLGTWTELLDLPAMEIVCLPIADDHAKDVHIGWARAALRQRDATWARALLKAGVVVDEPEALADLLGVLPGGERDTAAAELIRWAGGYSELVRVLARVPGPWTGELADAVIAVLGGLGPARGTSPLRAEHHLAQLCRLADERLTPEAAPRLEAVARDNPDSWPLTELIDTLRFRHDMLAELSRAGR